MFSSNRNYDSEVQHRIDVPRTTWYKDPGLRKLYILMPILFLGATTNGYDGSLLNGLQTMNQWQTCNEALNDTNHARY